MRVSIFGRILITVFAALLAIAAIGSAIASSTVGPANTRWPMYQHDARHTGLSPDLGIGSTPQILWKTQLPYGGHPERGSGIMLSENGTAYLADSGRLFAIDSQDGAINGISTMGGGSRSTPAYGADGRLYWGFGDTFVAFTSTTGQLAWGWTNLSLNFVFGSSPVISDDGGIYFNHDALWSFSHEGVLRWVYPFTRPVGSHTSPAISPDGSIYTSDGVYFYAFRPDGTTKWAKAIGAQDQNAPAVDGNGDVYVGGDRAKLYAFNPNDGTEKWVFESDESQYYDTAVGSAVAIGPDGTIYFGTSYSGGATNLVHFYAVNPNGTLKWKVPISGEGRIAFCACAAPVVDRLDRVFFCVDGGKCYGYSSGGSKLWEYVTDPISQANVRTTPVLASNGTILILDGLGALHAIGDPTLPRLHIHPRPLQLMVDYNSPPFSSSLQITSTLSPITWTATIYPSASWITTPVANGSTPSSLQLDITAGLLATGTYSVDVWVTAGANNAAGSPIVVPVKLFVGLRRTYLPLISR